MREGNLDPPSVPIATLLVDESPDALFGVSTNGRILSWNRGAETLFGYSAAEALGTLLVDLLVPKAERDAARAAFSEALDGKTVRLEALRQRKDGTLVPVDVSMRRVDAPGSAPFIAVNEKDMTRFRHGRDQHATDAECTQQANRLKTEFLANMSHELRTPLNAIIGFAELMQRGKVGEVSGLHQEYLGDILTSSRHLLQLIDEVLDLARVENGKPEFFPELVAGRPSAAASHKAGP